MAGHCQAYKLHQEASWHRLGCAGRTHFLRRSDHPPFHQPVHEQVQFWWAYPEFVARFSNFERKACFRRTSGTKEILCHRIRNCSCYSNPKTKSCSFSVWFFWFNILQVWSMCTDVFMIPSAPVENSFQDVCCLVPLKTNSRAFTQHVAFSAINPNTNPWKSASPPLSLRLKKAQWMRVTRSMPAWVSLCVSFEKPLCGPNVGLQSSFIL